MWLRSSFHLFSTISLTLLIPSSYFVLANLASVRFLLSFPSGFQLPKYFLFNSSFSLYTNPNILCALVSIISLHALIRTVIDPDSNPDSPIFHPRVGDCCFFLIALLVWTGFGAVVSRETGLNEAVFNGGNMLSKVFVLMGMHEVMSCWRRNVVGPIVDRCASHGPHRWGWAERAAVGASLGGLWWWKLRDEVEALVAVVEVKRSMKMRVGLSDGLGWWLYYLTLLVGMYRVSKGVAWVFMLVFCRRLAVCEGSDVKVCEGENKV